jgi:hypothetical protein
MPEMTADAWNAVYPPGTPVVAYPGVLPDDPTAASLCTRLETRTRSKAWTLGHGEPVVAVEGRSGGISLGHVFPAAVPAAPEGGLS